MKIVLATGNSGKVKELVDILTDLQVEVVSLKEFPHIGEIPEDGDTFIENALIKARRVCEETGLIAVADDSGLEVDYLKGAPGVYSARYAGEGKKDSDNNIKLLSELKGVPKENRRARFKCAIAVWCPDGSHYTAEGSCEGTIEEELKGKGGFGYDPLFFVPEFDKTFGELDSQIKNRISHRARALEAIKPLLSRLINEGVAQI